MKTLTLTDICCYRDLKYLNTKSGNIFHSTGAYDSIDGKLIVTDGEHHKSIDIWPLKPIVRPLNLTTPITHKGETFVPYFELAKIAQFGNEKDWEIKNDMFYCNGEVFYLSKSLSWVHIGSGRLKYTVSNQITLFRKLDEWMYDYNGLIESGLAVSVDTLDNDPYAV